MIAGVVFGLSERWPWERMLMITDDMAAVDGDAVILEQPSQK
jgi:hypothetical protein